MTLCYITHTSGFTDLVNLSLSYHITHPCELFLCLSPSIIHCRIFWFLSRSSSGTWASRPRPLSSPLPDVSDAFLQPRRDSVLPLLLQNKQVTHTNQLRTSEWKTAHTVCCNVGTYEHHSIPVTHALERAGSSTVGVITTSPCILVGWVSVPHEVGLRPRARLVLPFSSSVVIQLFVVMHTWDRHNSETC